MSNNDNEVYSPKKLNISKEELATQKPAAATIELTSKATSISGQLADEFSGTLGILLTLADAVLGAAPEVQLKAYKDQIKKEMYRMKNRNQDIMYYELGVQSHRVTPGNIYLS